MTQNWLGISVDFGKVEDKTADSSSFELLKEGEYRATIKSVNKSELGSNHKPALTVTLTLDDENGKDITTNLFLPEQSDSESAIKFKNENLRNFFTRFIFRQLTKEEYEKLDISVVNAELQKVMTTQPNFAGAKVLLTIKQEPFISRDSSTRAIKWTDRKYNPNELPKNVLKLIQVEEQKGVEFEQLPVIMFSNKVAAFGFGFYNDYNEQNELKNSKSYETIIGFNANTINNEDNNSEVPTF